MVSTNLKPRDLLHAIRNFDSLVFLRQSRAGHITYEAIFGNALQEQCRQEMARLAFLKLGIVQNEMKSEKPRFKRYL